MARQNNFLLGQGEILASAVTVPQGGAPKSPPYAFVEARQRVSDRLLVAKQRFAKMPDDVCPGGEVVALVTMHPRYISKSDYPQGLFDAVSIRPVGSRPQAIRPEKWGIKKPPEIATTEQIFVAGAKGAFARWADTVVQWQVDHPGAADLLHIEDVAAFVAEEKLKSIPIDRDEVMLELVLHNETVVDVAEAFEAFATKHDAHAYMDRLRSVRGLSFLPVRAATRTVTALAEFSFVRVVRVMPSLRPFRPGFLRTSAVQAVSLPDEDAIGSALAVIFDGGLPAQHPLQRWVTSIEPEGIGAPLEEYLDHGLAVTGAFLFGPLSTTEPTRPFCNVHHVRILDEHTGENADLEIVDALDRIIDHLEKSGDKYKFGNISLGPNLAIADDEVTSWTARLDDILSKRDMLVTVAAGNDGELDAGLNRIQPPADGVNVLAVGALDRPDAPWKRAVYSCVGPGRSPGRKKPDGTSFGGSKEYPFMVLIRGAQARAAGTQGTSVAAPFTLHTASGAHVALGANLGLLAARALMIHRADPGEHSSHDVGWGRFEDDLGSLLTTDDDEAIVIFQGELPVGQHMRVPVPLPDAPLKGMVRLSATLLISPEVDPQHPGAYTRSGLEVSFRPNEKKFRVGKGKPSKHAITKPFFTQKNMFGAAEYDLRDDGHKWEPCLKHARPYRAAGFDRPVFDIYYHHRESGSKASDPKPIKYALIIGIAAPKIKDFYARVVRRYRNILVQLLPRLQLQIRSQR